jgi:glycosyltransferase involved in cell wall biosynthesis
MTMDAEPLVTVLTPVYNGADFLAECIESVLRQTYQSWEYIILNNASTDRTLEIAQAYAQADPRVRVHSNPVLLDIITNHNTAFGLASPASKYCKIVSADDWLFPECLARMVEVAEDHPSVGLVGSYQMSGGGSDRNDWCVKWDSVAYPSTVISGREICRSHLLGGRYIFGTPTSLRYRSDLVRREPRFYPNSTAEADTSACYNALRDSDFGFVHQVLSYERDQHVRTTTRSRSLNAYALSKLTDLLTYGKVYLSADEQEQRLKELWNDYYVFLGLSALERRETDFWALHKARLSEMGYQLDRLRLGKIIAKMVVRLALNPEFALRKMTGRRLNLETMLKWTPQGPEGWVS